MSKKRRNYLIVFAIIVILTAIGAYFVIQISDNLDYISEIPIQEVDLSTIEDGEYIGEYEVFPISVIVEVEVLNHQIVNITVIKHNNGQGEEAESIIIDVIDYQSVQVDSISGATYSSKVILLAIKDALE